jgi:hypothetical protein
MAAAEQSIQQRIANVEADISEAKEQLKAATGEERLEHARRLTALQQQLAALEQQKLLLMQQQAGATGLGSQPGCWRPKWPICQHSTHSLLASSSVKSLAASMLCYCAAALSSAALLTALAFSAASAPCLCAFRAHALTALPLPWCSPAPAHNRSSSSR